MTRHTATVQVRGPWSIDTSRTFWEGFAPTALPKNSKAGRLATVFTAESDWKRASVTVRQEESSAHLVLEGDGDLDAAADQVCRFLALDVNAEEWPLIGARDKVIGAAQEELPGLRPCGFHSPYEAAAWSVLSQRIRIVQAAKLRRDIIERHGDDGAFPPPEALRTIQLDLPGRKAEYLRAVANATLEGRLVTAALRSVSTAEALAAIEEVKGLGPFAAELVLLRGANVQDAAPTHEPRLQKEVTSLYGDRADMSSVAEKWRPFRTWASVLLRAVHENAPSMAKAAAAKPSGASDDDGD